MWEGVGGVIVWGEGVGWEGSVYGRYAGLLAVGWHAQTSMLEPACIHGAMHTCTLTKEHAGAQGYVELGMHGHESQIAILQQGWQHHTVCMCVCVCVCVCVCIKDQASTHLSPHLLQRLAYRCTLRLEKPGRGGSSHPRRQHLCVGTHTWVHKIIVHRIKRVQWMPDGP